MYVKHENVEKCFLGKYDIHSGTAQCVCDKVKDALKERDKYDSVR